MFKLHIVPAEGAPFVHELRGESLVIGRAAGCDLALADPFLSRQHSRFFRRGERLFVEDLGSRNGTQVNGRPVHGPTELAPGDAIQISGSVLTLVPPGGPAASGAPAGAVGGEEPGDGGLDNTVFLSRQSAADLLAQQTAGAATAAALGDEALRRHAERLKLLNEVHQALGRSLTLDALLELILDRVFDHLRPEQGVIFLKRPGGQLERAASRAVDAAQAESVELLASRSLAREVADRGAAALVLDAQTDVRLAGAESIMISGVRSLLAAPLLEREGTLGMIVLGSKVAVRQFNEEDMDLLVSVASVAALYIRNLALAEEAAERRLLAEELALARRIQLALLPPSLPELQGWELYGANTPSRGVSGDYFAVVTRTAGPAGVGGARECVLMVADVSGKGMAASLLTASLEAFAAGPIEDGLPPDEICAKLSRLLYRRTPPEKYATAVVAVIALDSGVLRYANAGHNPPFVVRAGGAIEELAATGVPIALLSGASYQAAELQLAPGDSLLLYTDGIVEANDPEGEEYGNDRLANLCRRHCQASCADLAAALDADLEAFVRGVPFADDRTLVMARRLPPAGKATDPHPAGTGGRRRPRSGEAPR
ncbi:MAG TPA: SpoIIE family protein phosphatase [Thermoanaerobaculia bacterium]|nr:SpoIIE family protein phosphatase [Thermoanaerobaculia bacterium]